MNNKDKTLCSATNINERSSMESNKLFIQTKPESLILFLVISLCSLVLLAIIGSIITLTTGHDVGGGFLLMINMDREANLPTYFSSIILFISSFLLAVISIIKIKTKAPFSMHWIVLAFGFLFMSIDEFASIHELMTSPLRHFIHGSGIFYYAWIIPAIILIILLSIIYIKFFLHLPRQTKFLFFVSACLYLGGAIIMEMVAGFIFGNYGDKSLLFCIEVLFEEVLEMTGVIVFIYSLLSYIRKNVSEIVLTLK